ncbi:hypothetical protein Tco_0251181 [Tanacetum coccineum]
MVAYLKKPKGSEGFYQIMDFLNASHIRYALTENPTIYVSPIKQFWQTATARTLDNGEIELTATIDGTESVVPQPRSPTQTPVADETVHKEREDSVERDATTATSLDAERVSGNINRTQSTTIPNDPFPQGICSGGSPRHQDAILVDMPAQTSLIKKVKKVEKIAKSSQARRKARIVVSDDEDDLEDPSKHGRKIDAIDQDPGISLVQHDAEIQGRYGHDKEVSTVEKDVSTAEPVSTAGATVTTVSVAVSTVSPTRNTGVSTANDITMAETMVYIRKSAVKDKGKGKMAESETVQTKTKLQQEQERLDFEAAVRLQAELEEEERHRIVRVHKAASSFNVEE